MSALDVWLAFDTDNDEEASHEANTYRNPDGTYRVEWSNTSVGLITTVDGFSTYEDAAAWLSSVGYQDFSS